MATEYSMAVHPEEYMYDMAPVAFVICWTIALLCVVATIGLMVQPILLHMRAARKAGFVYSSFGARADRVVSLLILPPAYSLTAACQMMLPGLALTMSFIRTVLFAWSAWRLMQLMFILGGGATWILAALPKEPVRAFAQPPCCCLRCPVTLQKELCCGWKPIRWMIFGVRQFTVVAPLLGLLDIMNKTRNPDDDTKKWPLTIAMLIGTIICSWSYKAFTALVAPIVHKFNPTHKTNLMVFFIQGHMILCKLPDLIINLALREPYHNNGHWTMPRDYYAAILSGWVICIVELLLALVARKMLTADMYPTEPDLENGIPLDMLATLEMNGVDTKAWSQLTAFRRDETQRDRAYSGAMEMEVTHPAAATMGKTTESAPPWSGEMDVPP
mmetsp:Transcript_30898/g.98561  ORF Transcript_30898/g.98561 Transcript_30898/m.98561 type:complete len:386 (-) Transcript_30898:138-1295(-)